MNQNDIINAHKASINHRQTLVKDEKCGCFYCSKIFNPKEITQWVHDKLDDTALCPYCEIDSVIGESSGYPITEEFLKAMGDYWFS